MNIDTPGKTRELRRSMMRQDGPHGPIKSLHWDDLTVLGWATQYPPGWRFVANPKLTTNDPSVLRRVKTGFSPSFEECLPRWTGGLDATESKEL